MVNTLLDDIRDHVEHTNQHRHPGLSPIVLKSLQVDRKTSKSKKVSKSATHKKTSIIWKEQKNPNNISSVSLDYLDVKAMYNS